MSLSGVSSILKIIAFVLFILVFNLSKRSVEYHTTSLISCKTIHEIYRKNNHKYANLILKRPAYFFPLSTSQELLTRYGSALSFYTNRARKTRWSCRWIFYMYSKTCKNIQKVFWIRFDWLNFKVHIQCRTHFPILRLHFRISSSKSLVIVCLSNNRMCICIVYKASIFKIMYLKPQTLLLMYWLNYLYIVCI